MTDNTVSIGEAVDTALTRLFVAAELQRRLKRAHTITNKKRKPRQDEATTTVYDQLAASAEPAMVDLRLVHDVDFRRRLPTHLKNGRILCHPNRFTVTSTELRI